MVTSQSNHLPAEVWRLIITHLGGPAPEYKDQLHMWTECRLVSKAFRYAIETYFIKYLVRNNLMRLEAVAVHESPQHWDFRVAGCVQTRFQRLSHDGEMLIFVFVTGSNGSDAVHAFFEHDSRWQFGFLQMCAHTRYGNIPINLVEDGKLEFEWKKYLTVGMTQSEPCGGPCCGWVSRFWLALV